MKTLLLVVTLTLTPSSIAFGQPNDTTDGWLNGTGWESYERTEKSTYVYGLYQGILTLEADLDLALPNQRKLIREKVTGYVARQSLKDFVTQIDDFYKDRANVRIPVPKAVFWVAQKIKGKSTKELDAIVVAFRRQWNK